MSRDLSIGITSHETGKETLNSSIFPLIATPELLDRIKKATPKPESGPVCIRSERTRKPLNFVKRAAVQAALSLLLPIEYVSRKVEHVWMLFSKEDKTIIARKAFSKALALKDLHQSKLALRELIVEHSSSSPRMISDFLSLPQVAHHLREIMQGANLLLEGEMEELFHALKGLKGTRPRISSHEYLPGSSFALYMPLLGEMLFWKDSCGQLRLQFEAHPLDLSINGLYHHIDYLKYRLSGKQQGPYGSSRYTDASPLVLQVRFSKGSF